MESTCTRSSSCILASWLASWLGHWWWLSKSSGSYPQQCVAGDAVQTSFAPNISNDFFPEHKLTPPPPSPGGEDQNFATDPMLHGKPMHFSHHGAYMVNLAPFRYNPGCIILAALRLINLELFCSIQQAVTVIQAICYGDIVRLF